MTTEIIDTRAENARACFVPITKLLIHEDNVRRTDRRAEIETLAASIHAHGLLQNLSVIRATDGRYAVVAGARRLAALRLLAKQGRIARDFAAPCNVLEPELGAEASLAENVQRLAMNPMDEMEAFADLVDGGLSPDNVARRFGASVRHVEQRLALGRLSPRLRAAYRKAEITLDVARAFCLAADHETQERLFRELPKPIAHAARVRAVLAKGRMPASDKLARFVGVETYEAAGGRMLRDLFEDDVAFLENGDLVRRLAAEKLDALRDTLSIEGWGWVEVDLAHGISEGLASERLHASWRTPTAEEADAIKAIEADLDAIDGNIETSDDADLLWERRSEAEAHLDLLRNRLRAFDPQEMRFAGCAIAIGQEGGPVITRGLVKRADVKALRKLRSDRLNATQAEDGAAPEVVEPSDSCPRLPKRLLETLAAARTAALRDAVAQDSRVALAIVLRALSSSGYGVAGIGISSRSSGPSDRQPVSLMALTERTTEQLMAELAPLVAATLDFTLIDDARARATANELAAATDLDMSRSWSPDEAFWLAAPKAYALAAIETSQAFASFPDALRRAKLAALTKLAKPKLVEAAIALVGPNWLPEPLITPTREGALVLTVEGEAALYGSGPSPNAA